MLITDRSKDPVSCVATHTSCKANSVNIEPLRHPYWTGSQESWFDPWPLCSPLSPSSPRTVLLHLHSTLHVFSSQTGKANQYASSMNSCCLYCPFVPLPSDDFGATCSYIGVFCRRDSLDLYTFTWHDFYNSLGFIRLFTNFLEVHKIWHFMSVSEWYCHEDNYILGHPLKTDLNNRKWRMCQRCIGVQCMSTSLSNIKARVYGKVSGLRPLITT